MIPRRDQHPVLASKAVGVGRSVMRKLSERGSPKGRSRDMDLGIGSLFARTIPQNTHGKACGIRNDCVPKQEIAANS